MRYKVVGPWCSDSRFGSFIVQAANAVDTRTGHTHVDGAFRVVDGRTGKPAVKGKGGSIPFFGETAWSDAERLASDLALKETYA